MAAKLEAGKKPHDVCKEALEKTWKVRRADAAASVKILTSVFLCSLLLSPPVSEDFLTFDHTGDLQWQRL